MRCKIYGGFLEKPIAVQCWRGKDGWLQRIWGKLFLITLYLQRNSILNCLLHGSLTLKILLLTFNIFQMGREFEGPLYFIQFLSRADHCVCVDQRNYSFFGVDRLFETIVTSQIYFRFQEPVFPCFFLLCLSSLTKLICKFC